MGEEDIQNFDQDSFNPRGKMNNCAKLVNMPPRWSMHFTSCHYPLDLGAVVVVDIHDESITNYHYDDTTVVVPQWSRFLNFYRSEYNFCEDNNSKLLFYSY